METICIGKIVNTHGIKGEVKIQSYSDFDAERYKKGATVYIKHDDELVPHVVSTFRKHKEMSLVSFEGKQNINLVEMYKNDEVYIDKKDRKPLKNGVFYRDELVGFSVYDEENQLVGTVKWIEDTNGAQNNMRVAREGKNDILIPYIPVFILEVKKEEKMIRVHLEEGLL